MKSIFNKKKAIIEEEIFIPIGRSCHCTMLLDKLGLRKCSYPMDWIIPWHTSEFIEERFNFLVNGFQNFFDFENFEKDNVVSPTTGHVRIFNNITGFWFYHDFDANKTIKEQYKEISEKYKKRIKRCITNIKQAKTINLIYIQNTWDQIQLTPSLLDENILKICMNRIQNKYPKKYFKLYIFEHNSKFEKEYYEKQEISSNIVKFISNHSYTKNNEKLEMILSIEKIFQNEINIISKQ